MTPATGCLHCHGPRPDGAARRWICPRCGRRNSQALSGIDWSRHPRLVRRERILILFFWVYPAIAWALAPGGASEEIAPTLWVFGIAPAFLVHGARQRRRHWLPFVVTCLGLLVLVALYAEAFDPPDAPTVFLLLPWLLGIAAAVSLWAATARGEVHVLAETHVFASVEPVGEFPARLHELASLPRYCLYCFSHDVREREGSLRCRDCAGFSRVSDRRLYWNLNHRYERLERGLRIAVVTLALGFAVSACDGVLGDPVSTFVGIFVLAMPILGYLAWLTLSTLRLHHHDFSPSLIWTLVFLGGGALLLVIAPPEGAPSLAAGGPWFLGAAVLSVASGPLFSRHKDRRIRRGRIVRSVVS